MATFYRVGKFYNIKVIFPSFLTNDTYWKITFCLFHSQGSLRWVDIPAQFGRNIIENKAILSNIIPKKTFLSFEDFFSKLVEKEAVAIFYVYYNFLFRVSTCFAFLVRFSRVLFVFLYGTFGVCPLIQSGKVKHLTNFRAILSKI